MRFSHRSFLSVALAGGASAFVSPLGASAARGVFADGSSSIPPPVDGRIERVVVLGASWIHTPAGNPMRTVTTLAGVAITPAEPSHLTKVSGWDAESGSLTSADRVAGSRPTAAM